MFQFESKGRKNLMFQFEDSQEEGTLFNLEEGQPFHSMQAFDSLDEAHPFWLYSIYQFKCYPHPQTPSQVDSS